MTNIIDDIVQKGDIIGRIAGVNIKSVDFNCKKSLEKYKIIKSAIDTIHLGYNVTYKNTNTKESFTLIKEDNDYKIYKYYIHREK